jgi:tripartite-type tricarboxylate transporter receptor subunit TctC
MKTTRLLAAAAASLLLSTTAYPQAYPDKPVRLVMAVSGGAEVIVRIVAQRFAETLGQPMLLEVQSGAGGAVGANTVARAAPDGYTLLLTTSSAIVMRVHLATNTPYDPVRDFTPIIRVAEAVQCVAANPSAPFSTLKGMVEYARANPGKLSYGSSGVGTIHHLSAERIRQVTNINMVHVPYKTAGQLMTDVISGQIPVGFTILATITPNVKAGKLRILAIYNTQRYHAIPDVPTVSEEVPGYEPPPGWMGYLGPAALPRAIVTRLYSELAKFYKEPQLQGKADGIGFMLGTSTPEEFGDMIKRDLVTVGRIVKAAGIQPE